MRRLDAVQKTALVLAAVLVLGGAVLIVHPTEQIMRYDSHHAIGIS
jgi:hypothetical protein